MPPMPHTNLRTALAALVALAALAAAFTAAQAGATPGKHQRDQRLVVRADATAVEQPCSAAGICPVDFVDGRFRGSPVGTGSYSGSIELDTAAAFPNGEGGICAPLRGRLVLGAGTPDRLVLGVAGDSCQDGAAPLPESSFTALALVTVNRGHGYYAHARGSGLATLSEDSANRHRLTLIGRIGR